MTEISPSTSSSSCSDVNSNFEHLQSSLDDESGKHFELVTTNSWLKSTIVTDEKYFRLIKYSADGRATLTCLICPSSKPKNVVAYLRSSSNLMSHVKVRNIYFCFGYDNCTGSHLFQL